MRRGRRLIVQTLLMIVVLGGVGLFLTSIVPGTSRRLQNVAAGWIVVEILLEVAACASYAVLFLGMFSRAPYTVPRVRGAQIALGELGAFVVAPSGAAGPVLRVWALARGGMPFAVIVARSVTEFAIFNFPYVVAACVLGTGVLVGLAPGQAPTAVALAPLGVIAGSIVLAGGLVWLARRQQARGKKSARRWRRLVEQALGAVAPGLRDLPVMLRRPWLLFSAFGYWAGDCGVLVVAFHAVHGSAPIAVAVLAYMLGQLGNALPLPGGIGGIEPIMLGILTASGVNIGLATAAILLYRFVSLGLQAILGALGIAGLTAGLSSSDPKSAPAR